MMSWDYNRSKNQIMWLILMMLGKFKRPEQIKYLEYRFHHEQDKPPTGLFYLDIDDKLKKIIEAYILHKPKYIWNGWALLLEDGFWRFGCGLDGYLFETNDKTRLVKIKMKSYGCNMNMYGIKSTKNDYEEPILEKELGL